MLTTLVKKIWNKIDINGIEKNENMSSKLSKIAKSQIKVSDMFSKLWIFIFMPLMFVLLGNQVDFSYLTINQTGIVEVRILCF